MQTAGTVLTDSSKYSYSISVVICTYNRAAYITEAIHSLCNQTLGKAAFEVIVVNNNSTDDTEAVCREFMARNSGFNFHYYNEGRQGASFARNTGAAVAKAPLLCFMDDDAIANTVYLESIVNFFEQYKDADALGGRIIPKYIPAEPKWMSHYVSSLVGNFEYSKEVTVFKPGKYPLESNMIVKTEDFRKINGFNEALPGVVGTLRIGGEGKDLFLKLQALGKKVYYSPAVEVQHVTEVQKLTREYMYRVASGIGRGEKVRTKKMGNAAYIKKIAEYIFKWGASVVLAVVYIFQGNPAKALPVIRFRIDALKGLLQ
jgi:glucosyl-dolichyl phosphate glucuronosyltransferase